MKKVDPERSTERQTWHLFHPPKAHVCKASEKDVVCGVNNGHTSDFVPGDVGHYGWDGVITVRGTRTNRRNDEIVVKY
jgi:hypothetical protein